MFRLSESLGQEIADTEGAAIGRLDDLVVRLEPQARVVRLRIRLGRRRLVDVPWEDVASFDAAGIRLRRLARPETAALGEHELLLERHVLDAQIVDLAGKCLTRVGDVELALRNGSLAVTGVEVGAEPLLRRLGLSFLARHAGASSITWADLHLGSYRGRRIQIASGKPETTLAPRASHAELLARLAPRARRRRFRLHWIRRRAPT
jgi:sporulation protein YlmC with PRC-barrel domain